MRSGVEAVRRIKRSLHCPAKVCDEYYTTSDNRPLEPEALAACADGGRDFAVWLRPALGGGVPHREIVAQGCERESCFDRLSKRRRQNP